MEHPKEAAKVAGRAPENRREAHSLNCSGPGESVGKPSGAVMLRTNTKSHSTKGCDALALKAQ